MLGSSWTQSLDCMASHKLLFLNGILILIASSSEHFLTCSLQIYNLVLHIILRPMAILWEWFRRLKCSWDQTWSKILKLGVSNWHWQSLQLIMLSMWWPGTLHSFSNLATSPLFCQCLCTEGCVKPCWSHVSDGGSDEDGHGGSSGQSHYYTK